MLQHLSRPWLVVFSLLISIDLFSPTCWAQEEPQEKAKKYHGVLVRRPSPGYLFDRFYNAWLDVGTLDSLEAFLQQRVAAEGGTPDRLLLAFFYSKHGDDKRSLEAFRQALEKDPGNAAAWYEKAVVEARTLDYETAIQDIHKAGESNPDGALATRIEKLKGQLLVRNRETEKALQVWQNLLSQNPRDEDLYEDIIELQLDEGLYDEAAKLSEQLVERTRDAYKKVIRHIRTGDIYQRGGKRAKALEVYSGNLAKVGAASWIEKEVLAQIEQLFRREDDLKGLATQYTKLLEQYPKRILIRKRYANLLAEQGDQDAALKQFEDILELTPGDRANREEYIGLLAKLEKLEEATKQLEGLIEQQPDDGELRIQLANLWHQQDDQAKSVEAIKQYLAVSDKSEYTYLRAANMLARFEFFEAAGETYQQLVDAFPDSVAAKEARAAYLYERDEKEAAIAIWRSLVEGQDRSQLVRVARMLAARREHQAAFDILHPRESEFSNDAIYLGQLITEATALNRFDEAIPWAVQRVQLAETAADLETAVSQAAGVINKVDKSATVMEQLRNDQRQTVQRSCLLSELHERQGERALAEAALAEAAKQATPEQQVLIASQEIRLHMQRRDWGKAAIATKRLLELPGGLKSIHVRRLVELYQRDFRFKEALVWVQQWKKISPGSTLPWLTESRLLALQGKSKESLNVLRTAVQQFDNDVDLRARLAQAYSDGNQPGDANRVFWRLYEDSEDVSSKVRWAQELARTAQAAGSVERLVEQFKERRASNRQSIVPLMALAEVHRTVGNYEERRKALLEATQQKRDDVQLLYQIARIEESEGDWERALETLTRADKIDKSTRSKEQMARLYLTYGDADKGYAILFELAGRENSDARSAEAIADAMIGQHDWERVVEFLQPLMERYPDNYRLAYQYATALEETDQARAAVDAFLHMMEMDKEIPGRKQAASGRQVLPSNYISQMQAIMPREAVEYFMLMYQSRNVYRYRQTRRRPSVSASFFSTNLEMPGRVEDVRTYALTHLLELCRVGLDEDELAATTDAARARGVANLELLRRLFPSLQSRYQVDDALLEDYPEDKSLMALWVVTMMNSGRGTSADDVPKKAMELFKDSYPQLAAMAGVYASRTDEDLIEPTLQLLSKIEQPSIYLMQSISQMLMNRQTAIPEKMAAGLTEQLVRWYPRVQQSIGYQGMMIFQMIAAKMQSDEDPANYFAFLEDEIARHRSGAGNNAQMARYFPTRRGQMLLQPLAFPPHHLPNMPPQVMAMVVQSNNRSPFSFVGPNAAPPVDDEVYAQHLTKIKDPILRVLFAAKVGKDEIVDAEMKKLVDEEHPTLDAFVLSAAYAQHQDRPEDALRLLEKSRHLPMTRETRKFIDAQILAAANGLDKRSDEQLEVGQKAALRLRAATLQGNERVELISAMEDLGMKQEAEKLEQQQPTVASRSVPNYSVRSGAVAVNPIQKLLTAGKKEQAIRALTTQLAGAAANLMQNPGMQSRGYLDSRTRNLISQHRLTNEILEQLKPGESTNHSRLMRYASVCQLLGEVAKAKAAYESILKRRPQDDQVRLQLMTLSTQPDEMLAYAKGFRRRSIPMIGNTMQQLLQNADMDVKQRLLIVRGLGEFVGQFQEFERLDLQWLIQLTQSVGNHINSRGRSLYPLYQEMPAGYSRNLSASLLKLRRDVHDELCRVLLKHPRTTEDGFSMLLAVAEVQGESTEEFETLARESLLLSDRKQGASFPMQMYYGASPQRFRRPAEFLVRASYQDDKLELLTDEVIPALEKAGRKSTAKSLRSYLHLYTCDPEDFIAVGKTFVKQSNSIPPMPFSNHRRVIEVWTDRELDQDLRPLFIDELKQMARSPNVQQIPQLAVSYAVALTKRDTGVTADEFVEQVSEMLLGPKAKRAEFLKKNYRNRRSGGYGGAPNMNTYAYRNLLQQMSQREELTFLALQLSVEAGLENDVHARHQLGQMMVRKENVEKTRRLLEVSPFVKDLDEFRAFAMTSQTVWGELLYQFSNALRDKTFRDRVLDEQPHTFGWDLLRALTSGPTAAPSLLDLIAEHRAAISSLKEDRRYELGMLAHDLHNRGFLTSDKLSTAQEETKLWVLGLRTAKKNDFTDVVLKAKRWDDLGQYQDINTLRTQLASAVETNPKETKAALFHLIKLAEKANPQQSRFFYDPSQSVGAFLIQEGILNRRNSSGHSLRKLVFLLDVYRSADPEIEFSHRIRYQIRDFFREHDRKHARSKPIERIKAFHQALGEQLGDVDTSILANTYIERLGRMSSEKDLKQTIEWAEEQVASDTYADVARQIAAAAKLRLAANQARNGPVAVPDEAVAHYLAVGRDPSLPSNWRLEVLTSAMNFHYRLASRELIFAAVDLLADPEKTETFFPPDSITKILNQFATMKDREQDDWKDRAQALTAAWNKRLLRPTGRRAKLLQSSGRRSPYQQANVLLPLLKVNLEAGNDTDFDQLSRRFTSTLQNQTEFLALLVRHDRLQEATRVFQQNFARQPQVYTTGQVRFDEQLREQMPKFFARLDSSDQRYIAEILLSALQDQEPPPKPTVPNAKAHGRNGRLTKLADRYDEVEFASLATKERALFLLFSAHHDCATSENKAIWDGVKEVIKDANLFDIIQGNMQQQSILLQTNVKFALQEQDPHPLIELMESLGKLSVDNDWQRLQLVSSLTKPVIGVLADHESLKTWEPEKRTALAKAYRAVVTNQEQNNFSHDVYQSAVLIHIAMDQMEALEQWAKENERIVEQGQQYMHPSSIMSQLGQLVPRRNAENLPVRLVYLGRYLRALHALGYITVSEPSEKPATIQLKNSGPLFSSLTNYGFVQRDDLLKHAAAIAKEELGYVWAAVALTAEQRFPKTRNPRQQALPEPEEAWRKAIEAAGTDELEMRFRLELARLFKSKDRIEDAKKVIQEKKNVPKSLENAVQKFMKSVSDAKSESKSASRRPRRAGIVGLTHGQVGGPACGIVRQNPRIGGGPHGSVDSYPMLTLC